MCECCKDFNPKINSTFTYYCSNGKLNKVEEYFTNIQFPSDTKCIYIPSNITIIPIGTFNFYNSQIFIKIPKSVKTILQSAFFNCRIEIIDLSKGVSMIDDVAFEECIIKEVKINFDIIKDIGYHPFGETCLIQGGLMSDIDKINSHPFLNEYTRICQTKKFLPSGNYFTIELEFPPGKELPRDIDPLDGEEVYTGFEKTLPNITIKDYSNLEGDINLCTLGGDNYIIPRFFQNNETLKDNSIIHSDLEDKNTWKIAVPWIDDPIDDLKQEDLLTYYLQNPEYDIYEPLLIMWV